MIATLALLAETTICELGSCSLPAEDPALRETECGAHHGLSVAFTLLWIAPARDCTEACVRPNALAMTVQLSPAARISRSLASSSGSQAFAPLGAETLT